MSVCRITPTKIVTRSKTTPTMQLQLKRSISVENGTATLALQSLIALLAKSSTKPSTGTGISTNATSDSGSSTTSIPNSISPETTTTATNVKQQSNNGSGTVSSVTNGKSSISLNSHHQIPSDILDDIASRFIINTPADERQNLIRICFQIELAHWFYLDFYCDQEEKKLIPCGLKQFALHLFQHIPFLRNHLSGIDKILEDWKEYKLSVPTYGAILVSEDLKSVLLVQSYWAKSSWGFPKGKINEHEDPVHCATREVYEETGFDITKLIIPDHYIECVINYQYTRLYIIRNVSTKTTFSPRTRKEIKCCEWFPLDYLPTNKSDPICKAQLGINANSFFMIIPFMRRLKKWINDNRSGIEPKYSSTSPITTFNNNNGCGNYYGNNGGIIGNGNGNGKQHNSAKKLFLDFKDSNNTNSNALKGTNNANNNNKNKRQRHKSMGDIDGIKLKLNFNNNYNSNNGNNRQVQVQQDNKAQNAALTPKSNCINKDINSANECFFEDNSKYSSKHVNSKRQLFSCVSVDGSTNLEKIITSSNNNNINNNNNNNKKDNNNKDNRNFFNNNNNNNLNTNNKNGGNINNNNVRSRTKSLGQNNHIVGSNGVQRKNSNESKDGSNMRKRSQNLQQQPEELQQEVTTQQSQQQIQEEQLQLIKKQENIGQILQQGNNNKQNFFENINNNNKSYNNQQRQLIKLKQQHEQLKAEQQKLQLQNISDNAFNPNFDSWTNFSFTKNFIANVFC